MRIILTIAEKNHVMRVPYPDAPFVVSNDDLRCPHCDTEIKARMPHPTIEFDTYRGDAVCAGCDRKIGHMTAKVSTIFGIEEDRRVLEGHCRVY